MELRNKEVKYVYLELMQWATHIFILIVFPIVAMVATFATYATGMAVLLLVSLGLAMLGLRSWASAPGPPLSYCNTVHTCCGNGVDLAS